VMWPYSRFLDSQCREPEQDLEVATVSWVEVCVDEPRKAFIAGAALEYDIHAHPVITEIGRRLSQPQHLAIDAVDALSCALGQLKGGHRLKEKSVPWRRGVGEDVLRSHAEDEAAFVVRIGLASRKRELASLPGVGLY